jgi:large subunit ribosomal protein L33
MREKIKLESSAGTGHFYTNVEEQETHAREDGDQEVRSRRPKHVMYKETKLK